MQDHQPQPIYQGDGYQHQTTGWGYAMPPSLQQQGAPYPSGAAWHTPGGIPIDWSAQPPPGMRYAACPTSGVPSPGGWVPAPGGDYAPPTAAIASQKIDESELGILNNFIKATELMLNATKETFFDCPLVAQKCEEFQLVVKDHPPMQEVLCKAWYREMSPFFDACENRNFAPFLEGKIKFLDDLKFKEKYEELTDAETYSAAQIAENIENFLQYIMAMNRYARLYNQIPQRIGKKIESKTLELAKALTSGTLSAEKLNIFKIGQEIIEDASGTEIDDLLKNISGIYQAVGGMDGAKEAMGAGVAMPDMPDLGPIIASLTNPKAMPDLSKIIPPSSNGGAAPSAQGVQGHADDGRAGTYEVLDPPPKSRGRGWKSSN